MTIRILHQGLLNLPEGHPLADRIEIVSPDPAHLRSPDHDLVLIAPDSPTLHFEDLDRIIDRLNREAGPAVCSFRESDDADFSILAELPGGISLRALRPQSSQWLGWKPAGHDLSVDMERTVRDAAWLIGLQIADLGGQVHLMSAERESGQSPDLPELAPDDTELVNRWLGEALTGMPHPTGLVNPTDWRALQAGLLLIHGFLDQSHSFSQSVEGRGLHAAGDYWHGIMHRREPDASNAKYWFRRVDSHPVHDELSTRIASMSVHLPGIDRVFDDAGSWSAAAFVDLCEEARRHGDRELTQTSERLQWIEMLLLLRQNWRDCCS